MGNEHRGSNSLEAPYLGLLPYSLLDKLVILSNLYSQDALCSGGLGSPCIARLLEDFKAVIG